MFEEFWAPIVLRPNGVLDFEQVKRELHDYRGLLEEVPKVYMHITEGRISKPHTLADAVIGVHDELWQPSNDYGDDDE